MRPSRSLRQTYPEQSLATGRYWPNRDLRSCPLSEWVPSRARSQHDQLRQVGGPPPGSTRGGAGEGQVRVWGITAAV